jgi:hypothetical protein
MSDKPSTRITVNSDFVSENGAEIQPKQAGGDLFPHGMSTVDAAAALDSIFTDAQVQLFKRGDMRG